MMIRRLIVVVALALPSLLEARVLLTTEQALALAFPPDTIVKRETFFLTPEQATRAREAAGVDFRDELIVRYSGTRNGTIAGYVYFDTHRVRTLPETVMIVLDPAGSIIRIEILSFSEPSDYFPKRRWLDQLKGRRLDQNLSLNRSIRPISGATLTGRAIVNASRKVLALHGVLSGTAAGGAP